MFIPIMTFSNRGTAVQAASLLRKKGNAARVVVESPAGPDKEQSLFVLQTQMGEKIEALASMKDRVETDDGMDSDVIRCPQCNSLWVEYPNIPQASPTMKAFGFLMELFERGKNSDSQFHCGNCDSVWK